MSAGNSPSNQAGNSSMLSKEKQMEVLEACDLTKSYRSTGQLTGVDHHTVKRLVVARALGTENSDEPAVRSTVAEAFADKIHRVDRALERQGPCRRRPRQVGADGLHVLSAHRFSRSAINESRG